MTLKEIDECIEAIKLAKEIFSNKEFDTVLSILQAVRENGVGLSKDELQNILDQKTWLSKEVCEELASALHAEQMKGVK